MFAQIASYSISHRLSPPLLTGLLEVERNRKRNCFSVSDVLKLKLKPPGHEKGMRRAEFMGFLTLQNISHVYSVEESCRHQHSPIKIGLIQEKPSCKTYHFHGVFRTG